MASSFLDSLKALATPAVEEKFTSLKSSASEGLMSKWNGLVSPEKSSNGNSGDPSKSVKQLNRDAEQSRSIKSNQSNESVSVVEVNSVDTSSGSAAEPKSTNNISSSNLEDNFNNPFTNDGYRNSPSPGILPPRELDESEDNLASISVRAQNGTDIVSGFSNFFLQSVVESEQEKYQVVETFTAFYAFFYGKRPPMYTFSGILLNDPKQNWANTFKYMYENYFRGTASANLNSEAVITYDKKTITGYLLNLNMQQEAMSHKGIPFSFTVLVIKHDLIGYSSDFDAFIRQEQEKLIKLRQDADDAIKVLNSNPDGLSMLFKNQALKSKKPAVRAKKKGAEDDKKPPTTAKTGAQQIADNAVKSATALKNPGGLTSDPSAETK
jgi:hypothetical protein